MITTKQGLQVLGAVTTPLPPDSDRHSRSQNPEQRLMGGTNLPKICARWSFLSSFIYLSF